MKETPKTFKELFANTGIEPTTDESGNTHYNFKATLKEETPKEIAERYYEDEVSINAFINGYKLAQEQIIDFLYSEITERRDYSASKMCEKVIEFIKKFKNK